MKLHGGDVHPSTSMLRPVMRAGLVILLAGLGALLLSWDLPAFRSKHPAGTQPDLACLGLDLRSVRVRVVDAQGIPVAHAEVGACDDRHWAALSLTGDKGSCVLPVPRNQAVDVLLTGGGVVHDPRRPTEGEMGFLGLTSERVTVPGGSEGPVWLHAVPVPLDATLTVNVRSMMGDPIHPSDVYASVSPLTSRVALTDANGSVTMAQLPRQEVRLEARAAPGYMLGPVLRVTPQGQSVEVRLKRTYGVRLILGRHEGLDELVEVRACTSAPNSWRQFEMGDPDSVVLGWDPGERDRTVHVVARSRAGIVLVGVASSVSVESGTVRVALRRATAAEKLLLRLRRIGRHEREDEVVVDRLLALASDALPAVRFAAAHELAYPDQCSSMVGEPTSRRLLALMVLAELMKETGCRDERDVRLLREAALSPLPEFQEVGRMAARLLGRCREQDRAKRGE